MTSQSENLVDLHEELGLEYFCVALRILSAKLVTSFTPSLQLCQAFVLAALYFDCLGRPLYAWKMIGAIMLDSSFFKWSTCEFS